MYVPYFGKSPERFIRVPFQTSEVSGQNPRLPVPGRPTVKKKQELQKQELLHAIETSPRSYEEIMAFLSGKKDPDEE